MIHVHGVQNFKIGKLRCQISNTNDVPLFFSLVDYRNNLFTSNDPKKIMEFYDGFDNRDQLIQWMRERPKGVSYIHEVEGDKDIIVVIPTADFNGKYAGECRDNIFKGLHMVFVESGIGNFYFNYAHNCNVGIKRAMAYNPKWVVVSNDDMYKIDDSTVLRKQLESIDHSKVKTVFTSSSNYHSRPMLIASPRVIYNILLALFSIPSRKWRIQKQTYDLLTKYNYKVFYPIGDYQYSSLDENGMRWFASNLLDRLCFKGIHRFINSLSFGIYSGVYIKKMHGMLLEETYINEMEDTDISVRLSREMNNETAFIKFKIGECIGSSIGNGINRTLRVVPGYTYFAHKVDIGDLIL